MKNWPWLLPLHFRSIVIWSVYRVREDKNSFFRSGLSYRISKVFSFHFHHPVHTLKNSCVNSKVAFLIIKWLEFSEVWRPPTRLITYSLRYTAPRIIHRVALFLLHPKVLLRSVEKSFFSVTSITVFFSFDKKWGYYKRFETCFESIHQ